MIVDWDKIVQRDAHQYYKKKFGIIVTEKERKRAESSITFLKYTMLAKAVTLMKVDKGNLICGHSDCGKIVRSMMQKEHEFIVSFGGTEGLNHRAKEGVVYKILDALVRSKTWTDESTKRAVEATVEKSDLLNSNVRTIMGVYQSKVAPDTFSTVPAESKSGGNKTLRGGGWRTDFTRRIRRT
jgi:hypothetical protein